MNKELAKFIRNILGLTQEQFGKKLGYSKVYVTYVETGLRDVSRKYESKIKEVFDISTEDMIMYEAMLVKTNKMKG
ncbi:helix-turn-helix transcriptional regulator [Peribacillus frigoritolerans]|nr:helix-turn-helix transcriptional regulator [Peribacillus frigoritolerans]